ncbi:hypothetical protein KCP70_16955 [Salmonella enterica subsp. enterica]|nr:hypothetical protein KCP70_16955 [Salmonella enterica subsp. enterica]
MVNVGQFRRAFQTAQSDALHRRRLADEIIAAVADATVICDVICETPPAAPSQPRCWPKAIPAPARRPDGRDVQKRPDVGHRESPAAETAAIPSAGGRNHAHWRSPPERAVTDDAPAVLSRPA